MQAYLDKNQTEGQNIGNIIMFLMFGFTALGFAIAGFVFTGWMPLGERANILRSSWNYLEIIVIVASTIYAIGCLRTAMGIRKLETASQRWAQWMLFFTIMVGAVILLSVIVPVGLKFGLLLGQGIDLRTFIDDELGGLASISMATGEGLMIVSILLSALLAFLALIVFLIPPLEVLKTTPGINMIVSPPRGLIKSLGLVFGVGVIFILIAAAFTVPEFPGMTKIRDVEIHRLIAGLIFFIPGVFAYLQVRQVAEESDELRRAIALTPGKYIRSELAKSPSAGAIIGFIAIFLSFTMATDLFLEPSSIASFLSNVATKGVIAIGVTYLMISGEFDLSVGSILGVTALSFMLFMTEGAPLFGVLDPIPAALLAIIVAGILGAINGIILITTRIPSFIVTLGTLLAYRAISLVAIAGGRILRYRDYYDDFPILEVSNLVFVVIAIIGLLIMAYSAFRVLPMLLKQTTESWSIRGDNGDFGTTTAIARGTYLTVVTLVFVAVIGWLFLVISYHITAGGGGIIQISYFNLFNGRVLSIGSPDGFFLEIPNDSNIRLAILWWFIFVVIFHIILTSTSFGNSIFATGGNAGAARAQGINVDRVKVQNFVLVAMLTGIAAIYETARNPGVDPLKGQGWELDVIAMTVIGGALLTGGYGSVVGSLLGALIFGMLQTGLVLVGIESRLFTGTVGVIIIGAVVLNTFVRGARRD
jgi:ribose/xylose/arabinose/galactoside ABC-type transport system permease subunit